MPETTLVQLAKVLSSGLATNQLHRRPGGGGSAKKKMRLQHGPVPQQHKDVGKALAQQMEDGLTGPMMRASRERFLDITRCDLRASCRSSAKGRSTPCLKGRRVTSSRCVACASRAHGMR